MNKEDFHDEKFVVIKHVPSCQFIALNDEVGPFAVELLEMAAILPLSVAKELIGTNEGFYDDEIQGLGKFNTSELRYYEVEVKIKSEIL